MFWMNQKWKLNNLKSDGNGFIIFYMSKFIIKYSIFAYFCWKSKMFFRQYGLRKINHIDTAKKTLALKQVHQCNVKHSHYSRRQNAPLHQYDKKTHK